MTTTMDDNCNLAALVLSQRLPVATAERYAGSLARAGVLTEYAYQDEAVEALAKHTTMLQADELVRYLWKQTSFFANPGSDGHENTANRD